MTEVQEIAIIFVVVVLSTLPNANVTESLDNTKNIKMRVCLKNHLKEA